MLTVKSLSYKKIELPEIGDSIHYGQIKTFSESQYGLSPSLAREIKSGKLLVLERKEEGDKGFVPPTATIVERVVEPAAPPSPPPALEPPPISSTMYEEKIDELHRAIASLTQQVSDLSKPVAPEQPVPGAGVEDLVAQVMAKLSEVSEKMDKRQDSPVSISDVSGALAKLSQQVSDIRVMGPVDASSARGGSVVIEEARYIPDIVVEDMSNNVVLENRTLGHGGKVNDSLAALRKLKNKEGA